MSDLNDRQNVYDKYDEALKEEIKQDLAYYDDVIQKSEETLESARKKHDYLTRLLEGVDKADNRPRPERLMQDPSTPSGLEQEQDIF